MAERESAWNGGDEDASPSPPENDPHAPMVRAPSSDRPLLRNVSRQQEQQEQDHTTTTTTAHPPEEGEEVRKLRREVDGFKMLAFPQEFDDDIIAERKREEDSPRRCCSDGFALPAMFFQAIMIALYFTVTKYDNTSSSSGNTGVSTGETPVASLYFLYSGITIMVFVGFGYLMTFLRRYQFSALGFTFLVSAMCFEWGMLAMAFWEKVAAGHWTKIDISILLLVDGMFAAATVMITFGAILGKTTVVQLMYLALLEVFFYSLNFYVGARVLKAVDVGGSMYIHTFGAYFGLAATMFLSSPKADKHPNLESEYRSDITAFIGTIFLWIFWPSFNGAFAGDRQFRVVINTVLSLCGSCICTFLVSRMAHGFAKFDMVSVQNATLAGGVAVGSSADLVIEPGSAMLIGSLAGTISTIGFLYLTPYLARKIKLMDTCGIHNLHGIPGIIGALAGVVATATSEAADFGGQAGKNAVLQRGDNQPLYQLAALGCTLGISIVSGALSGWLVKKMTTAVHREKFGDDSLEWEVPEGYSTTLQSHKVLHERMLGSTVNKYTPL